MVGLAGKTALVTGASRGIGAAIARALVADGGLVIGHYNRQRRHADALAETLGRDRCHFVQADLEQDGAAARLWRTVEASAGRIDVLINNAGIFEPLALEADDVAWTAAWLRHLKVNLVAAAEFSREAIRHFRARGGGIIINIASRAAFRGDTPEYMHYAASKGGMVALTRSIARGFARDNILAYVVAPGFVRTEMAEDFIRRTNVERVTSEIPLGEMASPDDVAVIVAFLASGRARHATGTSIDVNGASYVH